MGFVSGEGVASVAGEGRGETGRVVEGVVVEVEAGRFKDFEARHFCFLLGAGFFRGL